MNRLAAASLLALALAACTRDLHLGSRACGASPSTPCPCDSLAGDDCACTDTADCPDHFYCVGSNAGGGHCVPLDGCTVSNGQVSCGGSPCASNAPACEPEACNANICANNTQACCANDHRCYPATCIGCCD